MQRKWIAIDINDELPPEPEKDKKGKIIYPERNSYFTLAKKIQNGIITETPYPTYYGFNQYCGKAIGWGCADWAIITHWLKEVAE